MASPDGKGLDMEAAQALKMFVKKNRPGAARTLPFLPEQVSSDGGADSSKVRLSGAMVGAKSEGLPGVSAPTGPVRSASSAPKEPELLASFKKFDIFDNIDEDRVKEFEAMFAETRAASNYDDFKKKTKKADPNKFATCNGVGVQDDGHRILT